MIGYRWIKGIYNIVIFCIIFLCVLSCNREVVNKEKEARRYFDNYQYNKAIEILETIKSSRRTAQVDLLLGKSYFAIFEFDKADRIFKNTFKNHPSIKDSVISAYMSYAKRFEKRKREDLAVKAYISTLNIESEYNIGNGFYTLGHHYYVLNELSKARYFLERGFVTIADSRIYLKTKMELMDTYEILGMLEEAIEISQEDESDEILYRRGEISYKLAKDLFTKKDFDSSLIYCKDIIEVHKPKVLIDDTYFLMGEIYSEQRDYGNALTCYKKVVKLDRFENNALAYRAKKKIEVLTQIKERK